MSLKRYAAKRDANEPDIVAALEAIGCDVIRLDKPVDLLVGFRGRTVLLEVKTKDGKLTEDQKKFFGLFRGEAYVVRTPSHAIEVMTRG